MEYHAVYGRLADFQTRNFCDPRTFQLPVKVSLEKKEKVQTKLLDNVFGAELPINAAKHY
jgi:hypothetical protein